jgi:hypothetical protein
LMDHKNVLWRGKESNIGTHMLIQLETQ